MIVRIHRRGKSFKGLSAYLRHDKESRTSAERVAFALSINCANEDIDRAVDEMLWTYRAAEALKQEAGVRGGGRSLEKPVKHVTFSLPHGQTLDPTGWRGVTDSYLEKIGASDCQAILVIHTDKQHEHGHLMLNIVHPGTGLALDDNFDFKRAQEWRREYEEHERERARYENRELHHAEIQASLPYPVWNRFEEEKQHFIAAETERISTLERGWSTRNVETGENGREWEALKDLQRLERERHFAEGKVQFGEVRRDVYFKVREDMREEWAGYYKKVQMEFDEETLAWNKKMLLGKQTYWIDKLRNERCEALKESREWDYEILKAYQMDMRHGLHDAQARGEASPHIFDLLDQERARPAPEAAQREYAPAEREKWPSVEFEFTREWRGSDLPLVDEPQSTRDGIDIIGNLGFALAGGVGTIGERLFDGFFGGGVDPKQKPEPPAPTPARPEFPKANLAEQAAQESKARDERDRKAKEDEQWDEYWSRKRD